MNNFIEQSDKELAQLIIDKYSDYIDEFLEIPNFNQSYITNENKIEILSCSSITEAVLLNELEFFIRNKSSNGYFFIYSINRHFIDRNLILIRTATISFEKNIPKYKARRISAIRDKKINDILDNEI